MLEKLPSLSRNFSYSSCSPLQLQEDKERTGVPMKNCQQDTLPRNNCLNPVQMKHNSATARQKIYSEEKQKTSLGRPEMDTVFPLMPGSHKMASNRSNCHADSDYFLPNYKKSLDLIKKHQGKAKQTPSRREDKHDGKSKLERLDSDSNDLSRERGETNSKSLSGYQILREEQRILYENEVLMAKEIAKKEILLQEKLLKVVETLRKVQLRKASEDKEQRNTGKAESGLYYTEKDDWEHDRERDSGGRRHGHREGSNIQVRGKYGIESQENQRGVKETNDVQKEKERERTKWENRVRNTQRTTKTVEKEWDHFDEMMRHTWERASTEKDKTRRERAMKWQENEMTEWDQRDLQEKEIARGNDGEKRRRERAKLNRHTELMSGTGYHQQRDLMDTFASISQIKEDHLATQERVHQYNYRAAEEMPLKKVLPAARPSSQNDTSLQQVQVTPERILDTDVQLVPCKVCNRHFTEDRLEKHISVCQKIQKPKRQVYNSSQYRAKGTDLEKFLKTNWRQKSPEPRKSNRRQKIRQAYAPGGFLPSTDLNPDYVTCPHCSRRFAPGPAERHIPKCQYIKSRPPPPRQHY